MDTNIHVSTNLYKCKVVYHGKIIINQEVHIMSEDDQGEDDDDEYFITNRQK